MKFPRKCIKKIICIFWLCTMQVSYAVDNCHNEGLDQCDLHSRPLNDCEDVIVGGMPSTHDNEIKICHSYYLTAANTTSKTPDWIAYHLSSQHINVQKTFSQRHDYFCPDPCLAPENRAELTDYLKLYPRYNRGHMDPASDNKWDPVAYKESFFLSNILPQNPMNNDGIWQTLEENADKWALLFGDLYIIDGPVYDYQNKKHEELGERKLWAPAALFKIIYNPKTQQALSFIIPNEDIDSTKLTEFLTSIDHINQLTGLDLFPEFSNEIKTKVAPTLWPLS